MKIHRRRFPLVSPATRGPRTLTLPERWNIKETKYFRRVPDPQEAYDFEPSGSVSQRSGSSYHQAKIVRKPLIATLLWLFLLFIFENDVNEPSKSKKQKFIFHCSGSGSLLKCHGSATMIFWHRTLWNVFVKYLYIVVRCHITVFIGGLCPCSTFNPTFWMGL